MYHIIYIRVNAVYIIFVFFFQLANESKEIALRENETPKYYGHDHLNCKI